MMDARELRHLGQLIPDGRGSATSIPELAALMCLGQREVRAGIEALVNECRDPIVTLPTKAGVFRAVCPEDLDLADAHLRAKAMSLLHRRRSLRLCRERMAWSPTLFR